MNRFLNYLFHEKRDLPLWKVVFGIPKLDRLRIAAGYVIAVTSILVCTTAAVSNLLRLITSTRILVFFYALASILSIAVALGILWLDHLRSFPAGPNHLDDRGGDPERFERPVPRENPFS